MEDKMIQKTEKKSISTGFKIKFGVIVAILIAAALLPFYGSQYVVNVCMLIFLYMSLGQMWNLLGGYSGLVSLGQQLFVGLGGYTLAIVTQTYGQSIVVGAVISLVLSVVIAYVISFPIFKMKGVYFTIGTWIIAETVLVFCRNWKFVKYDIGFDIKIAYKISMTHLYWAAMIVGVCSIILVYVLLKTKLGLALMSMRDNESSAEVRGVKLYNTKLIIFLISSAYTTLTGVVLYLNLAYVKPVAAFGIDWTVCMVFIVIIGGIGTIEGPIIGAIIYVILRQYLYNFPGVSMIILGAFAVIIILVAPKGIMGILRNKFNAELFSVRRDPDAGRYEKGIVNIENNTVGK